MQVNEKYKKTEIFSKKGLTDSMKSGIIFRADAPLIQNTESSDSILGLWELNSRACETSLTSKDVRRMKGLQRKLRSRRNERAC